MKVISISALHPHSNFPAFSDFSTTLALRLHHVYKGLFFLFPVIIDIVSIVIVIIILISIVEFHSVLLL